MTVFRTQLNLLDTTESKDIWYTFCQWTMNTSHHKSKELVSFCDKNSNTVDSYNVSYRNDSEKSEERLNVFYVKGYELFYIIFTQTYDTGAVYESSIVFNGLKNKKFLSFETTVSATDEKRIRFSKPRFFEYLKPYLTGDYVEDKFYTTDELNDPQKLAELMKTGADLIPFVYISRRNDGTYPYSDEEIKNLAGKLYCSAFVFKESDKDTSLFLKEMTGGFNAYNGAVGLYVGNQHRIYFEKNINQVTDRMTALLCLKPLSQELTVTFVRNYFIDRTKNELSAFIHKLIEELGKPSNLEPFVKGFMEGLKGNGKKNLPPKTDSNASDLNDRIKEYENKISDLETAHKKEIENLKNQYENEIRDYRDLLEASDKELYEKEDSIKKLYSENENLKAQLETYRYRFESQNSGYTVNVQCPEPELFAGEISDYLNGLMYEAIKERNEKINSKGSNREKDVTDVLLKENENLNWENSASSNNYESIKKEITKTGTSVQFIEERNSGHHIKYFHGDSRYVLTVSGTIGDSECGDKNLASCAEAFFLRPTSHR